MALHLVALEAPTRIAWHWRGTGMFVAGHQPVVCMTTAAGVRNAVAAHAAHIVR